MADALIDAVKENDVALVKQFIGKGVDVGGVDGGGRTALLCAARKIFVVRAKVL